MRRRSSHGHSTLPEINMIWRTSILSQAFVHTQTLAWRKYGITMHVRGEEVTLEAVKFVVVTQSRDFPDGCVGYPEDTLPQFEEGAREARVREVMIKEGMWNHVLVLSQALIVCQGFDPSKFHFGRKLTGISIY